GCNRRGRKQSPISGKPEIGGGVRDDTGTRHMIEPAYVRRMARYNRWQNQNLYGVADQLGEEERRRELGACFGSIHKTLSNLLWGDQVWMSRFADVTGPQAGIPESV